MISVEINTALKAHLDDAEGILSSIPIIPLSAYDQTVAPFIVYMEYSGTQSEEQWFLRISNIMYYIYDNNISRMKDIARQIDFFLNVGDNVQDIKENMTTPSPSYGEFRYRLTNSRKIAGSMEPPIEREGFAMQMLNFRVVYLDQTE